MEQPEHTVDRRNTGHRRPSDVNVDVELSRLNFKVDGLYDHFDDIKVLIAKQTEVLSTYSALQEKHANLRDRVENVEEKLEDIPTISDKLTGHTEGVRVAGTLIGVMFAVAIGIFGYMMNRQITQYDSMVQRVTSAEIRIELNVREVDALKHQYLPWAFDSSKPAPPQLPPKEELN